MVRGKNLFVVCCALMGVWTAVSAAAPVQFVDRAKALGIDMVNTSGATQEYIVEGMMGGVAFFDYDADGDVTTTGRSISTSLILAAILSITIAVTAVSPMRLPRREWGMEVGAPA